MNALCAHVLNVLSFLISKLCVICSCCSFLFSSNSWFSCMDGSISCTIFGRKVYPCQPIHSSYVSCSQFLPLLKKCWKGNQFALRLMSWKKWYKEWQTLSKEKMTQLQSLLSYSDLTFALYFQAMLSLMDDDSTKQILQFFIPNLYWCLASYHDALTDCLSPFITLQIEAVSCS